MLLFSGRDEFKTGLSHDIKKWNEFEATHFFLFGWYFVHFIDLFKWATLNITFVINVYTKKFVKCRSANLAAEWISIFRAQANVLVTTYDKIQKKLSKCAPTPVLAVAGWDTVFGKNSFVSFSFFLSFFVRFFQFLREVDGKIGYHGLQTH